ncbi:HTTM domain-containing protein [Ilumatobacter nonamiensis]|uniref:HTTM domain-containing protein n=1 Tax=Ilumatobacter nonamiensis TaxID=467093 RepID=UPI000688F29D|nr:HTTM domain-containing protein [Ilumatobacter nonamiensis]
MWSRLVDSTAPAERVAAFRMCVGVFVLLYLAIRVPVFWDLATRSGTTFDGVGLFGWRDTPLPVSMIRTTVVVAFVSGVGMTIGYRFRATAPVFALAMLLLTTYRSSWGQLLHFENLFTLHLVLLAVSPAADAWSLDARRGTIARREATTYGLVMQVACVMVVVTYVIAGIAKLRIGGAEWMFGDTLRNHISYSAVRLELLGGDGSPLAGVVVRNAWILPPMAIGSVIVELSAPIALLGGRWRNGWVAAAWFMHLAIYALMLVGFPYPLFLIAFTPFFPLERVRDIDLRRWLPVQRQSAHSP